jgi:hypothetical protein
VVRFVNAKPGGNVIVGLFTMFVRQSFGTLFRKYDQAAKEHKTDGLADALLRIGLLRVLDARSLVPDPQQLAVIMETRDVDKLECWLAAATTVRSVSEMLGKS